MKVKFLFEKILVILFLFLCLPLFAQNQPVTRPLVNKIIFIQKIIQSGDDKKLSNELEYLSVIKKRFPDNKIQQKEYGKEAKNHIKHIFTHLRFDRNTNTFKKMCLKKVLKKHNELIKECISTTWDGKLLTTIIEGESFDLTDKNGEVFEFGKTYIFKFDVANNTLTLFDFGWAG